MGVIYSDILLISKGDKVIIFKFQRYITVAITTKINFKDPHKNKTRQPEAHISEPDTHPSNPHHVSNNNKINTYPLHIIHERKTHPQ